MNLKPLIKTLIPITLFATAMNIGFWPNNYILNRTITSQERLIETQDRLIETQDRAIKGLEGTIDFLEELNKLTKQGIEEINPLFVNYENYSLTAEEATSLESQLQAETGTETAIRNNVCGYITYMFDKKSLKEKRLEERAAGTCVFVGENLVLTNSHVAKFHSKTYMEDSYTTKIRMVETQQGKTIRVKDIIAASPRHDLALLRTEEPNPDYQTVAIANPEHSKGDDLNYIAYSYDFDTGEWTLKEENTKYIENSHDLSIRANGSLLFPGMTLLGESKKGYSGSPIIKDGKIVGLLAQTNEEENDIHATDEVYTFLETAIAQ